MSNGEKVLVILAHPSSKSLCSATAATVRKTAARNVVFHDLYEEEFDPVMPKEEFRRKTSFDPQVQRHAADVEDADRIFIIHPDWWGSPPAILKGWVDRVITSGVGFEYRGKDFAAHDRVGLLGGKSIAILVTSDGEGDGIPEFWRGVWESCGVVEPEVLVFARARESNEGTRREWFESVTAKVADQRR